MNAPLIKPLLVGLVLLIAVAYQLRIRNPLPGRIGALLAFAAAIGAILSPDSATRVAHAFGVGRGADFVLYLVTSFLLLALVGLYGSMIETRTALTQIARELAIISSQRSELR